MNEPCTWCGAEVEVNDGFRAYEPVGGRRAVFCRLEHVIPWAIQGAHWGSEGAPSGARGNQFHGEAGSRNLICSHCGAELGEARVLLLRHRGEHRVADGFCSVDHLRDWAKAGGRWQ